MRPSLPYNIKEKLKRTIAIIIYVFLIVNYVFTYIILSITTDIQLGNDIAGLTKPLIRWPLMPKRQEPREKPPTFTEQMG